MNTLETMRARQARDRRTPRQSTSAAKPHLVAERLAAQRGEAPSEYMIKERRRPAECAPPAPRDPTDKTGMPWTPEELVVVEDRSLTARQVAAIVGRSVYAVHHQRKNR